MLGCCCRKAGVGWRVPTRPRRTTITSVMPWYGLVGGYGYKLCRCCCCRTGVFVVMTTSHNTTALLAAVTQADVSRVATGDVKYLASAP